MGGSSANHTLSDILDRARASLNDSQASIWSDELLIPHVRNAYSWVYNQIGKVSPTTFKVVVGQPYSADLVYTGGNADLTTILPADLWQPLDLEYRETASEEFTKLNRVNQLNGSLQNKNERLFNWEWRNRTIFVDPATANGLLRLTYVSLLPENNSTSGGAEFALQDASSAVQMDNVVEALAYFTAGDAYLRRGQRDQAAACRTTGQEFMDLILDQIVLDMQMIPTRGQRFGGSFPANQPLRQF